MFCVFPLQLGSGNNLVGLLRFMFYVLCFSYAIGFRKQSGGFAQIYVLCFVFSFAIEIRKQLGGFAQIYVLCFVFFLCNWDQETIRWVCSDLCFMFCVFPLQLGSGNN